MLFPDVQYGQIGPRTGPAGSNPGPGDAMLVHNLKTASRGAPATSAHARGSVGIFVLAPRARLLGLGLWCPVE
jgi:hypothetical protein